MDGLTIVSTTSNEYHSYFFKLNLLSIYYMRPDHFTNPYGAVSVTWLSQEKGTKAWLYAYTQTDSGGHHIDCHTQLTLLVHFSLSLAS